MRLLPCTCCMTNMDITCYKTTVKANTTEQSELPTHHRNPLETRVGGIASLCTVH